MNTMLFKLASLRIEGWSKINLLFIIPISCLDFAFYMNAGRCVDIMSGLTWHEN